MSSYNLLAGLPLMIDGYELEPLVRETSSEFTRRTTVVRLRGGGGGEEGLGEDVTYDERDQAVFQEAGPIYDLAGAHTLDSFSELIGWLDLFPASEPDAPNDVAPGGYNDPRPGPALPSSPLEPDLEPAGFRLRQR